MVSASGNSFGEKKKEQGKDKLKPILFLIIQLKLLFVLQLMTLHNNLGNCTINFCTLRGKVAE